MSDLFNFTDSEVKADSEVKQGWFQAEAGINYFKCTEVKVDDNNNLDFNFKGTREEELGNTSIRIWANIFDTSEDKFSESNAKVARKTTLHVLAALVPKETLEEVMSKRYKNWEEFAKACVKATTKTDLDNLECSIKLLLHYTDKLNAKTGKILVSIPTSTEAYFNSFISSANSPVALRINEKINPKTNAPYERIKPLSFYGVVPSEQSPSMFNDTTEEIPSF